MYSPVFLSCPTTSGSPPVLSISLSDHSFSALASSFACTLSHARPLWRFMFFSKRALNSLSSSARCSGDKSFLLLLMFRALVALIVVASRVSYLLFRCAPPHGVWSACLCVLINSQFPCRSESTRQYILARRRQANMRVSHLSPAARNRQENLGRLLPKRRLLLQRKHQISVPLLARPAKQISCLLHEKLAILRGSTLPRPPGSAQSCESLLRSLGDSLDYGVSDHYRTAYVYCSGPNHGQTFR